MTLRAPLEKINVILIVTAVLCACPKISCASNAVCPAPPGGQVTCEDGQLAFCRVNKGTGVEGGCRTPPKNLSNEESRAWTLSQVLGKEVAVDDASKPGYTDILRKGTANVEGTAITFKLPSELMKKVQPENLQQQKHQPDLKPDKLTPENIKSDKIQGTAKQDNPKN
jgi:hypothetical protein